MEKEIKKTTSTTNEFLKARTTGLNNFGDIAHRLELVAELNGVEWINDSKSTDLNSSWYSLELMQKPVIWIVGSSELEEDYAVFEKLVKFKVKTIVCFGKMETRIKYSLGHLVESYRHVDNLEDAVDWTWDLAKSGDAVLFSPACSSFDLFDDFRDRGNRFNELVNKRK
jgi:UDP-N-acetylmuramoylalanine--D-glutamate ligase